MQFCDEKVVQNLKNVNTDRCECLYDKCQYHQSRLLCLKNKLCTPSGNVSTVKFKLGSNSSKLLNLAKLGGNIGRFYQNKSIMNVTFI
jgi:hypothetical protein